MRGAEVDDGRHAAPTQSLLGSWLHGRYEVLRELGWGSLGHVYEASDHLRPDASGQPGRVALKVIRRDRLSGRSVAFLKQEFRALSRLDHPHVARVYDLDLVPGGGELFFSLELLLGPTLVARAQREPAAARPGLVIELAVQALRALGYVHARGLIHMDVKPQNLLVLERPEGAHLKLLDFHLAREMGAPLEREMRGTIAYMAPEVIKGEPCDARTDLYSLGAVLYEALGGRPPFAHAHSPMDMLRAHAQEPPPPLAELGVAVDPLLEALVRRLLAKAPAERFAGAEEALRALSAAAGTTYSLETEQTRRSLIRSGRFVGRDEELEQLLRPARQLSGGADPLSPSAGEPWVWLVRGEPGSGKSRLLSELKVAYQLEGLPCLLLRPAGVDVAAFGPAREALSELLRRSGRRQELLAALSDEAGALDPGRLVALRGDPSLPPRVRQGAALRELLEELGREAPFALLLDDLDQCDDGTREVVRGLASGPAPRLLVVASAGREGLEELLPLPGVQPLDLGQLGRAATAELIGSMAPGESVADELVARVWALASGNPRFVADVLRGLLEGEEQREPGSDRARLDAQAAERLLPAASLRELSARRVALLPPEERLLLAALACSPRARPLPFAAAVARLPLLRARAALRELERRGFAERSAGGGFDRELWPVAVEHAPLREAALAGWEAGPQPGELHARAARLLESRHPVAAEPAAPGRGQAPAPDRAPDRAEELLWHLERADDPTGALRYAWQAGCAALRRGEPLRALALLRRAEEALSRLAGAAPAGLPGELELGLTLAEARAATGESAAAAALLEGLAARSPTPPVLRALGAFLRERGQLRASLARLDEAAGLADGAGDALPWIEAERARTLLWMGEYRAALASGEAALQRFAAARQSEPPGELLVAMAHATQFLGRPAEAQAWLRRAGAALPPEGATAPGPLPAQGGGVSGADAASRTPLLGDVAGVQVARGPLEAALQRTERAGDAARHYARRVQLLEAAGDAEGVAWAELNLAQLRRAAGEHLGARVAYERARRGFAAADSQNGLALVRLGLARALAEGGAPARAAEEARGAYALGEVTGARWVSAQAEVAAAEAALARGALDEAAAALDRAVEGARALEHAPLLAELDLLRAELQLLRGDAAGAQAALQAWDQAPGGAPSALLGARADLARAALQASLATTPEARARLASAEGRAAAALALAERAGLPELTWRAVGVRAAVRAARGDAEGELADLVRGMEVLRGLCERVPAEERAGYLGDPRRAALRQRFRERH